MFGSIYLSQRNPESGVTNSGVRTLVCFDVPMDNINLFFQGAYANVEGMEVW